MMIKASKFAIAIALVGPLAIATAGQSFAASVASAAPAIKAAAPAAAIDVRYRSHAAQQYWDAPTGSCDPYSGTIWENVYPYSSNSCPDPYYGTYWDGWAPY